MAAAACCNIARCQDATDEPDIENVRSEQLYAEFAKTAASLQLSTLAENESFKLQDAPLMRFASEGKVFGSVYVWHDAADRLAMIGTIGSLPIQTLDMEFIELHLLKPKAIDAVQIAGLPPKTWNPEVESLQLKPVPDAPAVAATERGRLLQMRTIARHFTATMIHRERDNQLRLLPQPLYRYADPTPERDGAVFAFVWDTGTDPEVLLRFETLEAEGKPKWHYQPVRFSWRALTLNHDNNSVWTVEEFRLRDAPNQQTPYLTGLTRPLPLTDP